MAYEENVDSCCANDKSSSDCNNKSGSYCGTEEESKCGNKKERSVKPSGIDDITVSQECCRGNGKYETKIRDDCCDEKDDTKDHCDKTCCDEKENRYVGECCNNSYREGSIKDGKSFDDTSTCSSDSVKAHREPKGSSQSCSFHLKAAFEKYSSYLESARCICRSVLSSSMDKCCAAQKHPEERGKEHTSAVGYSSSVVSSIGGRARKRNQVQQRNKRSTDDAKCYTACSSSETPVQDDMKETKPKRAVITTDMEKESAREHVKINVTGMTCTGCSKKLDRALNNIEGVSNVDAVFVTSSADFDVDPQIADVSKVIQKVAKDTGFGCTRIITEDQTLDVLITKFQADSLMRSPPRGVSTVNKVDRKTYCVGYDPSIIGARSVLGAIPGAQLAPPNRDQSLEEGKKKLYSMLWNTVAAAIFTIPVVVLAWSDNPVPHRTRSIVSLVLATVVQAQAIPEFYIPALKALFNEKIIEMDMLVVISVTAAYGYSVVAFGMTLAGYVLEEEAFFETSTLLITLVLFGRLLALLARVRAVAAVSLRSLQAEKAMLVESTGQSTATDARLLEFGDTVLIPPHSQIVTDGQITKGSSSIDESMVTGESLPVAKNIDDTVIAGTINGSGTLTVRLTRLPGKNSITDVADLVESAYSSKPKIQDLADRVAGWIVPVVTSIATIVFVIWIVVCLEVRDQNAGGAVGTAITYGIAVLAISCPCAIGMAVPMVLVVAGGVAARAGVIIKNPEVTERGFRVTDAVFDKTGTITKADLKVVHKQVFSRQIPEAQIFSLIGSLLKDNQHPVSVAVAKELGTAEKDYVDLQHIESIPGSGVEATWEKAKLKAGNPYWLKIDQNASIAALIDQGMTLLCVTYGSAVIAVFGLKSNIRDEAQAVISELHKRNISTHIVSGDGPNVVEDVARSVNVPLENIAARFSPAEKQKYIQDLMSEGKNVLFCGDGTNDAVAVAQAHVGVQIGSASDVTRATAGVILLGGLEGIPTLLDVSKRAYNRMVFNFGWSAIYNLVAILLASGAFVKVRVPPAYAGLGEIVSVLPVIFAAMSMLYRKKRTI